MRLFHPKIFSTLKDYNKKQLIQDVTAGTIVAIIALPLSIALAISSGVTPEQGMFTAIIAGFIISLLGGSRVQIGGPTGAFMIIVFEIIKEFGLSGLITATMMAGVLMILFGILRFGIIVKYIPCTITTGFTTGIALTIFTAQIKDLFGLSITEMPSEFHEKWHTYFTNISTLNYAALGIGVLSVLIILITPRIFKKVPGAFIAIILTSLIVKITGLDVPTIGSTFGQLSTKIPTPALPVFSIETVKTLFPSALTIALLGSIESLLSAVVADGMIGGKHRSNTELIAQGIANIASALFGGIPATGAIARTAANIKNGGRTPIAGMTHAIVLLIIFLLIMPLANLIPLSALAGILIVVAYNMSEIHVFGELLKSHKDDVIILLVTFILTVAVDLVVAIQFGMVISAFLFIKRMSTSTTITKLLIDAAEEENDNTVHLDNLTRSEKHIQMYEINGPLFFGAADTFVDHLSEISPDCKKLILKMNNVSIIDATALRALKIIVKRLEQRNINLELLDLKSEPYKTLEKSGLLEFSFIEVTQKVE